MILKIILSFFFLALFTDIVNATQAPWIGTALNGQACDGGGQGVGPYDYNNRGNLKPVQNLVESAHFTPEVENLIKGKTSSGPEGDLNYTLRVWPNHHRALLSIIRFQLKINNKISLYKLSTPPECYLQRAIHFSPGDAVVYSLYGHYLRKIGHLNDAVKYYEKALELQPENSKFTYSFSLLLIELKRYDDAVKYAKIAYRDNKTPVSLKKKLITLGVWVE